MKRLHNVIVAAVLIGGCGAQMPESPKRPIRQRETAAQNRERIRHEVCAGLSDSRCFDYRNMLDPLKAVEVVLADEVPQIVRAYCTKDAAGNGCEETPPGKLLFQEAMPIRLEGCDHPGTQNGLMYCAFTIKAEAYLVRTLAYAVKDGDRIRQRFMLSPVVDGASRSCYRTEVRVFDDGRQSDPVSHHVVFDRVACPGQSGSSSLTAQN